MCVCQCSFGRKHDAITTSDPQGAIVVLDGSAIIRYRFASETAEFLICARWGIYIGAQMEEEGRAYAIANDK